MDQQMAPEQILLKIMVSADRQSHSLHQVSIRWFRDKINKYTDLCAACRQLSIMHQSGVAVAVTAPFAPRSFGAKTEVHEARFQLSFVHLMG